MESRRRKKKNEGIKDEKAPASGNSFLKKVWENDLSDWSGIHSIFIDICGTTIPKDILIYIYSFLDRRNCTLSLSLVHSSFYLTILSSWTELLLSPSNFQMVLKKSSIGSVLLQYVRTIVLKDVCVMKNRETLQEIFKTAKNLKEIIFKGKCAREYMRNFRFDMKLVNPIICRNLESIRYCSSNDQEKNGLNKKVDHKNPQLKDGNIDEYELYETQSFNEFFPNLKTIFNPRHYNSLGYDQLLNIRELGLTLDSDRSLTQLYETVLFKHHDTSSSSTTTNESVFPNLEILHFKSSIHETTFRRILLKFREQCPKIHTIKIHLVSSDDESNHQNLRNGNNSMLFMDYDPFHFLTSIDSILFSKKKKNKNDGSQQQQNDNNNLNISTTTLELLPYRHDDDRESKMSQLSSLAYDTSVISESLENIVRVKTTSLTVPIDFAFSLMKNRKIRSITITNIDIVDDQFNLIRLYRLSLLRPYRTDLLDINFVIKSMREGFTFPSPSSSSSQQHSEHEQQMMMMMKKMMMTHDNNSAQNNGTNGRPPCRTFFGRIQFEKNKFRFSASENHSNKNANHQQQQLVTYHMEVLWSLKHWNNKEGYRMKPSDDEPQSQNQQKQQQQNEQQKSKMMRKMKQTASVSAGLDEMGRMQALEIDMVLSVINLKPRGFMGRLYVSIPEIGKNLWDEFHEKVFLKYGYLEEKEERWFGPYSKTWNFYFSRDGVWEKLK